MDYLVLYHQEELPYDRIVEVLGIPLNTVRTHLHRPRNRRPHGRIEGTDRMSPHLQPEQQDRLIRFLAVEPSVAIPAGFAVRTAALAANPFQV